MVAYQQFVELSQSGDSEARGQAAHILAMAYVTHYGPTEEQAALYAALFGFLDDPSVKVRAALAYGLLHAPQAPRAVMLSLLSDAPVIARAVAQYSPVLLDTDLTGAIKEADLAMLMAIASRQHLTMRVADALFARQRREITLQVLQRQDVPVSDARFRLLATRMGSEAEMRGVLLKRSDLPASVRLVLVEQVRDDLREMRLVKGSIQPGRLDRLIRNASDKAVTDIGEREAALARSGYIGELVENDRINTRLMLHALVHGRVLFFADCLAQLSDMPREKVFTLLDTGSRPALNAMFARCGFSDGLRNLLARLVFHARDADLADDLAARHFVVTSLIEDLIIEHDGEIPAALEDVFGYLNEQNILLARLAARGVMSAFAEEVDDDQRMLETGPEPMALPAA